MHWEELWKIINGTIQWLRGGPSMKYLRKYTKYAWRIIWFTLFMIWEFQDDKVGLQFSGKWSIVIFYNRSIATLRAEVWWRMTILSLKLLLFHSNSCFPYNANIFWRFSEFSNFNRVWPNCNYSVHTFNNQVSSLFIIVCINRLQISSNCNAWSFISSKVQAYSSIILADVQLFTY